jgi:hypothetical protein
MESWTTIPTAELFCKCGKPATSMIIGTEAYIARCAKCYDDPLTTSQVTKNMLDAAERRKDLKPWKEST